MKNNTKLIMETWRRFLKEGPEGIDPDGMVVDEEEEEVNASNRSPVEDKDLESDRNMIDMDDMGEFNPYESSPIPPEAPVINTFFSVRSNIGLLHEFVQFIRCSQRKLIHALYYSFH